MSRMRPTFARELPVDADRACAWIRDRVDEDGREGRAAGRCADLFVDQTDRHVWSPYLALQVEEKDTGNSVLHGRFSPHPEVWTMFMFIYFLMAFGAVIGGTLAYVQWSLGGSPWGLWIMLGGATVIGLIHLASRVGKRLGEDQMIALRIRLDEMLEGLED